MFVLFRYGILNKNFKERCMKVFLKEDVKSLGKIGEVVTVSDGYARNFLLPKKLAVEANTKNIKEFEHHKRALQERAAKVRAEFKSLADKLSALSLTIKAKAGEEEKLFGSVTNMDIAEAFREAGHDIDKKKIVLGEPIKRLGEYTVEVKIDADVSAQVKVNVVAE
jgi:large subunit ribosomal protein L9